GEVICSFSKETKLDHLLACLTWRILDHGTVSNETVVAMVDGLTSGNLANKVHTGVFEFALPESPWSYQGDLFSIDWVIKIETGKKTFPLVGNEIARAVSI